MKKRYGVFYIEQQPTKSNDDLTFYALGELLKLCDTESEAEDYINSVIENGDLITIIPIYTK